MKYTFVFWLVITYCRLQLKCDFFGEQWEQIMCCHMSRLLIIKIIIIIIILK
jgi:hypothetical protein